MLRLLLLIGLAQGIVEFDNSIPGQPEISCSNGELTLSVSTEKGAPSHIFAKGHFRKDGCSFNNTTNATFEFSKCDVSRQREVNPKGMAYTMTVIVQLHPLFTTRVDRAYRVRCFYKEAEKAVGAEVSVSDPTPTLLNNESEQPTCLYTIHKGSPNGPLAKYAQLGDVLYHVWECPSQTYEMFVHDCFVVDGEGTNNRKVINEGGCSEDVFIMPHIIYNENRTKAFVNSNAFNFPDQNSVRFNCQIQICPAVGEACYRPNCNGDLPESTTKLSPSIDENSEPIGNELARDELITTSVLMESSTTTTTTTTTTEPSTTEASTTTENTIDSTSVPTDFPTPNTLFRLLKKISNHNSTLTVDEEEGSGIEITNEDKDESIRRELRRRDAVDLDISSPELMIVDKEFASDLPTPLGQSYPQETSRSDGSNKAVCLPFIVVWILIGLFLFTFSITLTAVCYTVKQQPRFQILP